MAAEVSKAKGNAAFKQGDWQLALAHYSTAMQQDPSSYTYPLNRALVYLKLGQYADAEKDASRALELEPSQPKALFRRGLARKGRGRPREALQDFQHAKQAGAGPEVDKEIEALAAQVAQSDLNKPTPPPKDVDVPAPQTSANSTVSSSGPSTSRLRAALSDPSTKTASTATREPKPSFSIPSNGFMTAVWTRKLSSDKTSASSPSSFAAKKEARAGKDKATSYLKASSAQSASHVPNHVDAARAAFPPTTEQVAKPSKPALASNGGSLAGFNGKNSLAPASGSEPATVPVPSHVGPRPSPRTPTTAHALEMALLGESTDVGRQGVLKTIVPSTLPSLLGSSLSPELLAHILSGLCPPSMLESDADLAWHYDFVRWLSRASRFGTALGLLDEDEKGGLRRVLEAVRSDVAKLEAACGL